MNNKRIRKIGILIIFCIMTALFCGSTFTDEKDSSAPTFDSLEHKVFNREDSYEIWESYNGRFSTVPPTKTGKIIAFALNENGMIAVAYENQKICIYNEDFDFQYAFAVDPTGVYSVDWHDDKAAYIDYRAACAIVVCDDGTVDSVYKFTDDAQFSSYYDETVKKQKKSVNGCEYSIVYSDVEKHKTSQMSLIRTDNAGKQTALYSHVYEYDTDFLWILLFSPLIIAAIIVKTSHDISHRKRLF